MTCPYCKQDSAGNHEPNCPALQFHALPATTTEHGFMAFVHFGDNPVATFAALQDDALARRIARDCHDKAHDARWCPTCAAREAGIEEYRQALRKPKTKDTP